ncbi:hypothetical protein EVAR_39795_1 [Eumeta japonica]|uniref:Uncharacterized protein n=1 Tax=Eumeta variegata TaxID=151549 RepID=A0A4C1X2W7_EUMVA|nr:hypothetical protein EVAR_39795_1 [Eumeta japonica]
MRVRFRMASGLRWRRVTDWEAEGRRRAAITPPKRTTINDTARHPRVPAAGCRAHNTVNEPALVAKLYNIIK